jgi:hypothetical protein
MLIAVENHIASGTADEPASVAGLGVTWTKVTTRTFGIRRLSLYRACASSVTTTAFTFSMTNAMTRVYVWGYDFTNVDTTSGGGVAAAAFIDNSSTATITITGTTSAASVRSPRYVFFGARGTSAASPTTVTSTDVAWASFPAADKHWVSSPLNANTVGDYISTDNAGKMVFATTGANAIIGVTLVPMPNAAITSKTYICSSSNTPATLSNGAIKIITPLTYLSDGNTGTNPTIFCWAPTSTAIDTNNTGYVAGFGYIRNKGSDNALPSADDTGTVNFQILQYSGGVTTTLASTAINESTFRTSGELWTLELVIAKETATQSRLIFLWDLPPLPATSTGVKGSISSGLISTPSSDLAFGIYHGKYNSISARDGFNIDYLSVTDYALVPQQSKVQAVNRSAVW